MTITPTTLFRAAGAAAAIAGLIFVGVQINHPHLDATSISTADVVARNSLKMLMAALALALAAGTHPRISRRVDRVLVHTVSATGLTAVVVGAYLLVVLGLGRAPADSERTLLILSMVAAAVAALAYVPARERLAESANRLVYGERHPPDEVLRTWGGRLSRAIPMDELLLQLLRPAHDMGGQPGPAGERERLGEPRGGQRRQQDLALRGGRGREERAHLDPQRDDLGHRDSRDVDDVRPVELGHRRGLAGAGDE